MGGTPSGPVKVSAHTRAGGQVKVPAHTRAAPAQQPAALPPPAPQAPAPSVTPDPAGSPTTVPGGAGVKPPKPVTGVKPHHFVPQTAQTVGTNPNPPAQRSVSSDAEQAPPGSSTSPLGYTNYFSTY